MKRIIGASCVFVCNQEFSILNQGGVLFECNPKLPNNQILELGDFEMLRTKYSHIPATFYEDCVLLPALSNAHIHFEFSNNQSHLLYGNFPSWLSSVITHREELFEQVEQSIQKEIKLQLASGVGSVGAVSSYGYDIALLASSPLRVTLFNEGIGSNPQILDFLYGNLLERFEECKKLKSPKFTPALAIHSPYSTHYTLSKKIASLAQSEQVRLSCHFLESKEEKQWLENKDGWFKEFFSTFFKISDAKPSTSISDFIELLRDLNPIFVHCLFADQKICNKISKLGGFIACSPRSNRLLNGKYLDLENLKKAKLSPIFSTDGLSSNYSLNLIEEIRSAFFGYAHLDALSLTQELILGVTHFPALALGNSNGILMQGKNADLAIFECKQIKHSKQKPLHFVLHSNTKVKRLYINGIGEFNGNN